MIGSAITSVSGVLAQMDPIASLIVVAGYEFTIRMRRNWLTHGRAGLVLQLVDMGRLGFLYGLFLEAFKLI